VAGNPVAQPTEDKTGTTSRKASRRPNRGSANLANTLRTRRP